MPIIVSDRTQSHSKFQPQASFPPRLTSKSTKRLPRPPRATRPRFTRVHSRRFSQRRKSIPPSPIAAKSKSKQKKSKMSASDDAAVDNAILNADEHATVNVIEQMKPVVEPVSNLFKQFIAALAVALGAFTVGFTSAYTSPALASMRAPNSTLTITDEQGSWIGSVMPLSALLGGMLGGFLIEPLGRRRALYIIAFPFIGAWCLIATASRVEMLYIARAISGFAVGVSSLAAPVYLGETLQPQVRGTLGLMPTALGNIGILVCFVTGSRLNWSELAAFGAVLPVPYILLMMIIPETPRWFVHKGQHRHALRSLRWLRGTNADIEPEFQDIVLTHSAAQQERAISVMSELQKAHHAKPLAIALGLMFFQQMSGINAVIFYTVDIFRSAGTTYDGHTCTIAVGIVNFIATFIAAVLIDRVGRKMLLYVSNACMSVSLIVLSVYMYAQRVAYDVDAYAFVPLVSFVVFVLSFSLGAGPVPWLMMGEILPGKIRAPAASIVTAFNWSCTFVVTKTFTNMLHVLGQHGTFGLFALVCAASVMFTFVFVPETRGKSLEDIEKSFLGVRARTHARQNVR